MTQQPQTNGGLAGYGLILLIFAAMFLPYLA